MKIAFYLDNKGNPDADYSNPYGVNPGIGGTQYMIWLISSYLNDVYTDLDIVLLANAVNNMPQNLKCIKSNTYIDALKKAKEIKADILVCRGPYIEKAFYSEAEKSSIKIIIWNHNFEKYEAANYMAKCSAVRRCVCVSKEQYDRLCDHDIFPKSTYIHNTIFLSEYEKLKRSLSEGKNVCYLGGLYKEKGFLKLAANWRRIEKKVPGIQLYVIGGANLYDHKAKLGKYGLADEKYEQKFIKYLVNKDGQVKPNIHFMGVVGGVEKLNIMKRMDVGVVNPKGAAETFCIGAIEFQALNVPVVTIKKYALIETVCHGVTGLLFKTKFGFVNNIVKLLKNKELNIKMGMQGSAFVKQKFNISDISKKWYELLADVYNDADYKPSENFTNMANCAKWIRVINSKIKKYIPCIPSILAYEAVPRKGKQLIHIICDKERTKK